MGTGANEETRVVERTSVVVGATPLSASLIKAVRAEVVAQLRAHPLRGGRTLTGDADDLTQSAVLLLFDAELRLLRQWDSSRGLSLQAYARLLVRRRVRRTLAGFRGNPWALTPEPIENLETALESSEGSLELESWCGAREALRDLDRGLSTSGRRLLRRIYFEGLTVDRAADAEGISRAAVHAWCSRIRRRLRKLLAG